MTHTHGFYTVSWRNKNIFPTCSVTFIPISGVGWVIRVPQLPWLEILGPFWWRNQVSVRVLCWHALFVLTCPANVGMCASNEPTKKMHSVHYAYKQDTALQKKEWLGIAICCPINCFFFWTRIWAAGGIVGRWPVWVMETSRCVPSVLKRVLSGRGVPNDLDQKYLVRKAKAHAARHFHFCENAAHVMSSTEEKLGWKISCRYIHIIITKTVHCQHLSQLWDNIMETQL